jgi:predicted TPR repeat methyltransferase
VQHKANDWIIKGEEFIRDFEGMYRNVPDPWDQEKKIADDQSFKLLLQFLQLLDLKDKNLLDLGCGPGHCARLFSKATGCRYHGADISTTAIDKARANLPDTTFYVYDVTQERLDIEFHIIVACKTVYYWGEKLNAALSSIQSMISRPGYFAYTYNYTENSFSNRYFTVNDLRAKLRQTFCPLVVADYYEGSECIAIDVWCIS